MYNKELLDRLNMLDLEASLKFDNEERYRIIIVGGSALILLDIIDRATHDIDAISVSPAIMGLISKYDMNCMVRLYENNFPFNYQDRLQKLPIEGKKIDFYTASLEDIVIAKLFSERETDRQDIISENVLNKIDWNKLKQLAEDEDEVKNNALNDRCYNVFRANYEEYLERYSK